MNALNIPLIAWNLKSARNAALYDIRIKIALGFLFILNIGISIWSSTQLLAQIQQWQMQGSTAVQTGLWLLCLFTWVGMCAFSVLGAQRVVSSEEALLMFTLPIPPATRFRTIFVLFFVQKWYVLLLECGVMSYVLISTLGWQGVSWLILLQSGVILTVLCTLIATLLIMRYILPRGQMKVRIGVALISCAAIFLIVIIKKIVPGWLAWIGELAALRPEVGVILFGLLLLGGLGLWAGPVDNLYSATFTTLQGWDRSRRALVLPGMQALRSLFERRGGLTAALFARSIANQSRSLIFWLRLVVISGVFTLFPIIHAAIAPFGFPDSFQVVIYATGLALVHIMEQGTAAISGEGNRLAIYLTAPYTFSTILCAKLMILLLPILSEAWVMGLILIWRLGLPLSQVGFVFVAITLIIVGCVTLLALGSVWDEDLNLAVEGAVQALLQEEAPVTPRRMMLLNLCLLCLALMFLLLWKLPSFVALLALAAFTGLLVTGIWRFSRAHLYKLLRNK